MIVDNVSAGTEARDDPHVTSIPARVGSKKKRSGFTSRALWVAPAEDEE